MEFKMKTTLDQRLEDSRKILEKYPEKVPIILEANNNTKKGTSLFGTDINGKEKKILKFLVPRSITVSQFMYIIRKNVKLNSEQAIYIFTESKRVPPLAAYIDQIYLENKSKDNFLYLVCSAENSFGER